MGATLGAGPLGGSAASSQAAAGVGVLLAALKVWTLNGHTGVRLHQSHAAGKGTARSARR